MQTITRSGMSAGSRPSRWRYDGGLLPHFVRDRAQRQLAQRREVALPEEVGQRLFDFSGVVDLPLAEARPQLVDRDVDVDHFVGAIQERVGHGLAHADAGDAADHVVQRLEMLDVDRGQDVDAGVEQLEDVLVAFLVRDCPARWCAPARRRRTACGLRARIASTSISSSSTPR